MERYWDLIEEIVRESDIVLEVLDARFPELSRNVQAEEIVKKYKRPKIFVLNKADLVNRKDLQYAIAMLTKEKDSEVVYVTHKDRKTIKILLGKIRQFFDKYGKRPEFSDVILKRPFREARADIVVGVIGYPNVGKSSIINSLAFKKKVKVSKKAGTTHGVHWIKANEEIRFIDTPGVIPLSYETEQKLGLIAARSPERLREPEVVAAKVIEMFLEKNIKRLEDFYGIKIEKNKNSYEILESIALQKKLMKKGGIADEGRISRIIVNDWQQGKLKL